MSIIRSQLRGEAGTILVVRMPPQLVDETSAMVREEAVQRLPNADGAGIVLDCAELELINSIGITCLLQVQDHCKRMRARLILAAVPPAIQTFLTQLKLNKRFPSTEHVDEAVRTIEG